MDDDKDLAPMRLAIEASASALARGDMPFGAVLVSPTGEQLHVAGNDQVTGGDFTGHAEMALLRQASMRLGREALRGCTVYASGEPCAMCAGALFWSGIARLVYAASTEDIRDALGADPALMTRCEAVLASGTPKVEVRGGLLRDAAFEVLKRFS